MAWIILIAAGVLEIASALAMKQSDGLTRLGPTAITLIAMLGSVWLLSLSMRSLPLGTAYVDRHRSFPHVHRGNIRA